MRQSTFEDCATAMLARERARTTTLNRLYQSITRRLGPVVSDPEDLRRRLCRYPERFLILDPPVRPADSAVMPDAAREERRAALESAGVAAQPRVKLVAAYPDTPPADSRSEANTDAPSGDPLVETHADAPSGDPLVDRIDASIRTLSASTEEDPTLADALAEALHETLALRRTLSVNPER